MRCNNRLVGVVRRFAMLGHFKTAAERNVRCNKIHGITYIAIIIAHFDGIYHHYITHPKGVIVRSTAAQQDSVSKAPALDALYSYIFGQHNDNH